MYQAHWGLHGSPFAGGLDRTNFFRSPTHDEALARLHFLVDEQRRLGLLLGAAGSGKSLVLEVLAHDVAREGKEVARLNLLAVGEHEVLWQLAEGLGVFPCRSETLHGLWRGISDRLAERRCQQLHSVVLLDDADEAPMEVLEHVVRLAQHDATCRTGLTIVLAAATHRAARLGRRLLSLADLRVDLEAWTPEDTAQFLADALQRCGREEPVFDGHAILRLHELAGGAPRPVCQLADLCLLAGAAQGLAVIDEDTVETVSRELGVREAFAVERVG
jgi:type II secretory pathway predicted ATPase ExeA